jgi:hypothetical protein
MFFVPYIIAQPPLTAITRKLGPTYFLGSIVISWGAILIVRLEDFQTLHLLIISGYGFRKELESSGRLPCAPWSSRGWLFPWLCLSPVQLVREM